MTAHDLNPPEKQALKAANMTALLFFRVTMSTSSIANITIATQANVYFDGKCVSHGITLTICHFG